ncbi:MAG: 50S ribosomal protein L20 [Deltaproteobacteria bacterium]|nr:50S ribosomal protein L20 [Deltaproteobacteria bacterium]
MARVKRGFKARRRRNKILKRAKGFFGSRSKMYKRAVTAVFHAQMDSYIGRRLRKRDMRKLWITRINAAAKMNGISYSKMIGGLKSNSIELNRKILSEIAIEDPSGFAAIASIARGK